MASDNQLERIASLIDRLEPLDAKARGMRIEADEWNAVVDILRGVLQIERAQVQSTQTQLEDRFAVKSHEHLGQVTTAWLDADLQARLGTQDSSLSVRSALADAERKIASLGTEVARLTALVNSQQTLIDRSAVTELDRTRTLKQFEDRFAGVENLRTLVSTLSTDVGSIRGNVSTLTQLRESLTDVTGRPIDVARLRQDVTEVQALRENLKGVDGNLMRLRDVELTLRELSDSVGVGGPAGGLDLRIASQVAAAEQRLDLKVNDRNATLQQNLQAGIVASEVKLRGELASGTEASRASLDQSLGQQVTAAEGRLKVQFDVRLAQTASGVKTETLAATGSLLDSRLAAQPDLIRTIATGVVEGMRTGLRDELRTGLTTDFDVKLVALDNRLSGRTGVLDGRVAGIQTALPGLVSTQIDTFGRGLETRITQRMDSGIDTARQTLQSTLTGQVRTQVADTVGNVDARIATTVDGRLVNLDARISQSVTTATRNLSQDVATEVDRQLTTLKLPDQIRDAGTALGQQLRAEQARALAEAQAANSTTVNNTVLMLRNEMSAVRTETLSTVDVRVNASNTALRREFSTEITSLKGSLKPDTFRPVVLNPGLGGVIVNR